MDGHATVRTRHISALLHPIHLHALEPVTTHSPPKNDMLVGKLASVEMRTLSADLHPDSLVLVGLIPTWQHRVMLAMGF